MTAVLFYDYLAAWLAGIYLHHFALSTRLAEHDVVITTYSLVSKEIPVQKEDAEKPSQDSESVVGYIHVWTI